MRATGSALLGLITLATTAGCILFTDPINVRPSITITGETRLFRRQPGTFTAKPADEDGQTPRVDWRVSNECPATLEQANERAKTEDAKGVGNTFSFPASDAAFCVWALAIASLNGRAFATHRVEVSTWAVKITGPDSVHRLDGSLYKATLSGEYGVPPAKFAWEERPNCESSAGGLALDHCGTAECLVMHKGHDPFCVGVTVTDDYGVSASARFGVKDVKNRPPKPVLKVNDRVPAASDEPVGIMSTVKISGLDSVDPDGDMLRFQYKLSGPNGKIEPLPFCAGSESELCVPTLTEGSYTVELTVTDGQESATASPVTFRAVDQPPCILATQPDTETPKIVRVVNADPAADNSIRFTAERVSDDGDPFPAAETALAGLRPEGRSQFRWYIREPGAKDPGRRPWTLNYLVIDGAKYRFGDQIEVTLEYLDRKDLGAPEPRDLSRCDKGPERLCSVNAGSKCYQRVSWTVDFR